MKVLMRMTTFLILIILGLMAYIRFAPTDADRWHTTPEVPAADRQEAGSFLAVRETKAPDDVVLEILHDTALATPRTRLIAGSIPEGKMTFETRSARMGFPDYTTVAVQGDVLVIYGRLRFGKADIGVNKARIEGWLEAVAPLTTSP